MSTIVGSFLFNQAVILLFIFCSCAAGGEKDIVFSSEIHSLDNQKVQFEQSNKWNTEGGNSSSMPVEMINSSMQPL